MSQQIIQVNFQFRGSREDYEKSVAKVRVLMICFIKFFKLKMLHLLKRQVELCSLRTSMSNTVPLRSNRQ